MTHTVRKLAAGALVLAVAGLAAGNALAIDKRVVAYGKHYVECKIWLITDWDLHRRHCTPSHVGLEFKSLAPSGTFTPGSVYVPPIIEPPVIPPQTGGGGA